MLDLFDLKETLLLLPSPIRSEYIEKKFQQETKSISRKTKDKIDQIISHGKKTKKTIPKS